MKKSEILKRLSAIEEKLGITQKQELTKQDYKDKTWYKNKDNCSLIFIDKDKVNTLAFNKECEYIDESQWFRCFKENGFHLPHQWEIATKKEVSQAFTKAAKKRGLNPGVKIKDLTGNLIKHTGDFIFDFIDNKLYLGGALIFKNKKWAEVIEVDKKVIEKHHQPQPESPRTPEEWKTEIAKTIKNDKLNSHNLLELRIFFL